MTTQNTIPAFGLYGESDQFPDVIHYEDFSVRAPIHDWRILPHRHGQMSQLFMVEDGWIDATVDGEKYQVSKNEFLYIPNNCVHEFMFRPNSQGKIFSLPVTIVQTISPATDQLLTTLSEPFVGTISHSLDRMARLLRDTIDSATSFRGQQVVGLAHSVLANLAETSLTESPAAQKTKHARLFALDALIVEHLSDNWSASDFAEALSISTGHLSRLCRAAKGVGAAAYIEQHQMQEACRLLAFTQLPVSEIGYRLGFMDPSYFSKRFRAARGQTPTDYRARFTN
ncbi:MAG: helix-turn-helix domain-containing protein [Rhodobacteraceae bacterium]|jgi:AraC family transcriptional activator of pobA|uniref:helix-turn-helix domain-containing protein n=1 Tax=Marivita sp. TaxID=2003365 RepID=UPI003B5225BB|nr:helix-turn-helix domain-containing protein [Paracoccaceae bacterium]